MNNSIITSIKYPLTIANGNLAVVKNEDVTAQSVKSFLETFKGERFQGDYGIKLYIGTSSNEAEIKSEITQSLTNEFNINFIVDVELNQSGELRIEVRFRDQIIESLITNG